MSERFTHWAGRRITQRLPYTMSSEVVVPENTRGIQVKDGDLIHRMDKPFDVQGVVLRLTALDAQGAVIDPQPTVLDHFITMRFSDMSKNDRIANDLPFRRLPGGEVTWSPRSPLVMHRAECFEAIFDGRESFATAGALISMSVKAIRIRLSLEGETLCLAPPMEVRTGDALTQLE
ncbi:MAG: hypothetical protein ACRDKS_03075 [Actinomycetota bacterium]